MNTQQKIHEILGKILNLSKEKTNIADTVSYIMSAEYLAKLLAIIEINEKRFSDKAETKRFHYILCLMIGYHLGVEREKEVN